MKTVIPDLIEPVVGWRSWGLLPHDPTEPRLAPFAGELAGWPAGVATTAVCPGQTGEPHAAPRVGCSCGLYAHKTIGQLWAGHPPMVNAPAVAWGTVALWGRVLEYETGYRAEYGCPQHLWTEDPTASDLLRDRYLIPVSPLSELMETKPEVVPADSPRSRVVPWVDRTGGRANAFIALANMARNGTAPPDMPLAWPVETVGRLVFDVPRGRWQRAIVFGVFETGGCQPHRWMDPQGACTPARIRSLSDVLAKLAGRGVTIKRTPGRWGGEFGSTYRVVAMGPDPVAAPKPRIRGYRVEPQW